MRIFCLAHRLIDMIQNFLASVQGALCCCRFRDIFGRHLPGDL